MKRQNQQMGTTSPSLPVNNNLEQNHLFSPSSALSPKSMGLLSMDNNNHHPHLTTTMQSTGYSPSNYYQHQRTSPGYRSFDSSNRNHPLSHESHSGISTPVFDEFLTPPPSSSSYLSMSNSSLSIHSHMNVSFQETTNSPATSNPSMMTPANAFNHHPTTMYPY